MASSRALGAISLMSDEHAENVLERRICLPEPDVENITVLTRSLPNEPILPWHHFDSPWLDREEEDGESVLSVSPEAEPLAEETHQLTLALEVPGDIETGYPDETFKIHPIDPSEEE